MTTEELKQEAIKKAYGEYWEQVRNYIDMDGWVKRDFVVTDSVSNFDFRSYFTTNDTIRPKSLSGIENNNQWVRIEEDGSNLPKKRMESWVLDKNGRIEMFIFGKQFNYGKDSELEYVLRHFSHYQPIIKPEAPLY